MTPHDLIAAFDAVAEAPDATVRLRELVLQLAVRGKLVPQDPADEPASALLPGVRESLVSLRRGVRSSRWEPPTSIVDAEIPYELPPGWAWARINDTAVYVNGMAFKHSQWGKTGLPIIRIQNLTDPRKPFNYAECDSADGVLVREGDILVSWSATLEAFIWTGGDGLLNQHIFRVEPCTELVAKSYLYWLLRQVIREMADGDHAHGLVMTHINRGPFLAHVVGIPPLAEQRRIVARVDELMGLLDQLEAARASRDATRAAARDSVLDALREADTPDQVQVAWNRFAERSEDLLCDPTDLTPLRQTVLQLAVRGRLVRGDAESWRRCRLGDQITLQRGVDITKGQQRSGPYPVVSSGGTKSYHDTAIADGPGVVLGRKGSVGTVHWIPGAYWPHDTTLWVRDFHGNDRRYVYHFLRSFPLLDYESSTANPSLNRNRLHPVEVMWPNRSLQPAIVARVDELMGLLDRFEERLAAARTAHVAFAAAAVHHFDT